MKIHPDLRRFLELLNDNQVRYLLVGGYAVALHGHPRYTKDMDLWLEIDRTNARRLIVVLKQFGFESLGLTEDDFISPNKVVQLGNPPNRIEILTSLSGVDFSECFKSRIVKTFDGVEINVIDIENLKRNKIASGRLQDLADVENLQ